MGLVSIPHSSKADCGKYLQEAVEYTADKTGSSEFLTAEMMSHFLERIAYHVSMGRSITIPGFGKFGVQMFISKMKENPPLPRPYPAFSGSQGFRNDTILGCPLDPELTRPIRQHRKRGHPSSTKYDGRDRRSVATGMEKLRNDLQAQKKRLGYVD